MLPIPADRRNRLSVTPCLAYTPEKIWGSISVSDNKEKNQDVPVTDSDSIFPSEQLLEMFLSKKYPVSTWL